MNGEEIQSVGPFELYPEAVFFVCFEEPPPRRASIQKLSHRSGLGHIKQSITSKVSAQRLETHQVPALAVRSVSRKADVMSVFFSMCPNQIKSNLFAQNITFTSSN